MPAVEGIAWFHACVLDGYDMPVSCSPEVWEQYLHSARAFYAIAHGTDAEGIAHGEPYV